MPNSAALGAQVNGDALKVLTLSSQQRIELT
jgi:hypothetical protein